MIGIDVNEAGLNNDNYNVIPARFGSVIYTTTKPTTTYRDSGYNYLIAGSQQTFDLRLMEALQRIFLYKSAVWSYEEEVRVVRNVTRHCCREYNKEIQTINRDSIKEIYIGSLHAHPVENAEGLYKKIKDSLPDCKVFLCNTEGDDWCVHAKEFLPNEQPNIQLENK